MTKEERLKMRKQIRKEKVRFTDDNKILFEHFERLLATYTDEELLQELIECGLEVNENDEKE